VAASKAGRDFDLTTIFNDTLVNVRPDLAVTVAGNHDTQPLQALEAPIEDWFKPLAYALLLLREKGYPCVFYADLYGARYKDKGHDGNEYEISLPAIPHLEKMMQARKCFAYGVQHDYLDHGNCIGWTREGTDDRPRSGCAILLSNGDDGSKTMEMGRHNAGKTFIDWLGNRQEKVILDDEGKGQFTVSASSVSVWIEIGAA